MIAIIAAAVTGLAPAPDGERQLAELRHIYAQSCQVRAYAAFDDLCNRVKRQLRDAERTHRRAARAQARAPADVSMAENSDSLSLPN